jgi:hypothetical protein
MNCAKCGKDMDPPTIWSGRIQVNISASTSGKNWVLDTTMSGDEVAYVKRQMGKYSTDTQYTFCIECVMDVLMGVK